MASRMQCSSWWVALLLCMAATASASVPFEQQLVEADKARRSDPQRFAALLTELDAQRKNATPTQLHRLRFLHAYQSVVYRNRPKQGILQAEALFKEATDPDLKFRAGSLLANSYALTRNFTQGLRYLNQTLPMRDRVQDKDIRHDGINSAAVLYNELGQYRLGAQYADETLSDTPNARAQCAAGLFRLEARSHLSTSPADELAIDADIERCLAIGDRMAANFIRVIQARSWASRGETDKAIALLEQYLPEVTAIGYHRLIADVRALLAELKLGKGDLEGAKSHAEATTAQATYVPSSLALVTAYKVLYEIAERRGQLPAALGFYRQYADADKAHLTDVKARELAYEIVRHETLQKNQQIELLEKQNQVLQLEQRVERQGANNTRLLALLLAMLVAGISYWAYKIKRVQVSLRRFAETDALTGICNRHHFTQQAEQSIARCARAGEPAALVMFDLDHFKAVNDSYGHVTGDWVLQRVAETCQKLCREIDYLGRLGGEEFAILLHGFDLNAATRLAEDCRVRIAQIETRDSGHSFTVTASFGVSSTTLSGYDLARLLSHADQVLYRAKRDGRNCVRTHAMDMPITLQALGPSPLGDPPSLRVVDSGPDRARERARP